MGGCAHDQDISDKKSSKAKREKRNATLKIFFPRKFFDSDILFFDF